MAGQGEIIKCSDQATVQKFEGPRGNLKEVKDPPKPQRNIFLEEEIPSFFPKITIK